MCASTLYVVVVFFHSVFKYKMFSEFQLKFKILSFPIKKYVSLWIIQKQKQRKHFYTRHLVHIIYLSRFYSIVIIVSILNEIESRLNSLFFSLKIIESAALRVFVIIVVRLHNSYSHTFTIIISVDHLQFILFLFSHFHSFLGENDGTLDSGEYHNQTKIDTTTTNTTDNYHRNSNHNNNNNKQQSNHSFNQSTNLRENYLNFSTSTETNTNNNNCNNRPPAIRSNSSASSLYPSLNSNNNNIQPSPNSSSSPTKSFTGVCQCFFF